MSEAAYIDWTLPEPEIVKAIVSAKSNGFAVVAKTNLEQEKLKSLANDNGWTLDQPSCPRLVELESLN